nr:presenilin associated rhomboid [Hymenolepis microstoma]
MNQMIMLFPRICVRLDIPRSFSLGTGLLSRLKDVCSRPPLYRRVERTPGLGARQPVGVVNGSHMFKNVFRCGIFTFVSVNTIFAGTMIWNYENWRSHFTRYRTTGFRDAFIGIVGRPPKSSDIFWAIAFANFVVYAFSNTRRFGPIFLRYFANSPYGPWPATSMVLSVFSHQTFFHLFLNMYVLHNFTQPLIRVLGMEQFFAVFLGGGIVASFLSFLLKAAHRSRIPSIGASGAVCAVLGAFCMLEPQSLLCVPLLVNVIPHSFTAGNAAWAIAAFECLGTLFLYRLSPIDHAAHLGGLLFGMYYGMEGKNVALRYRDVVIDAWRDLIGEERKPKN